LVDASGRYAQVLGEYAPGGGVSVAYVHGLDLISQARGGTRTYYHVDGLGSTRALTDGTGQVDAAYTYDAFGRLLGQPPDAPNACLVAGEKRDAAVGLDYLRARHLDPTTGRFVSRDTSPGEATQPITRHRYLYANADPVNHTDPSGNDALAFAFAGVALLAAI